MRRYVLPLGLAAIFFSPCAAQARPAPPELPFEDQRSAVEPLTLGRAVALAMRYSHAIAAARHRVEASDGGVVQAGLRRNPSFTALVEDTRRDARTATATIDVPLELGGKRIARTIAAERARDVAEAELANATADLRSAVTSAFFDVLVAQQRLALARDSAALAQRGADAIARRVVAGKTSPVDETRARVDEVDAALAVDEAETTLRSARQGLASLWNETDLANAAIDGDVEALLAATRDVDLSRDVDRAPSVFASRREVVRQRALLDVEKSRRLPDLTVTMGAKRDNDLGRTQAVVGLSIPLPLFDRNQGSVHEAAKRADQAEDDHQAARVRVRHEVQRASNQLALAKRTVATLKTRVLPAAEDAFHAASRGFDAGKFGFLDVIDAQRSLLAARTRYLDALSTAVRAATTIDRLLGP